MKLLKCCAIFLVLWLACLNLCHASSTDNDIESVSELLTYAMENRNFNGSVAIKCGDAPIKTYTTGWFSEATPLTSQHKFSTGSVGKQFTTVALLRLEQQKRLTFDTAIRQYLPNLPTWADKVTVHHLLSHTSGLPKVKWKQNIDTDEVMSQVLNIHNLAFEPGSSYLYSNINVMLRALIVKGIVGLEFKDYMSKEFFKPLGLKNTAQLTDITLNSEIIKGDYPTAIDGVTIYTTPSDLVIWEHALLSGLALQGKPIKNTIKQHPLSGKANHIEYDFGNFYKQKNKIVRIQHDGSNPSHHVLKTSDLINQTIIVSMSNDGNKRTLFWLNDEIMKIINKN